MPVVLCNAGPLMALGKLNRLDLLVGLYGEDAVEAIQAMLREVDKQAEALALAATSGQPED